MEVCTAATLAAVDELPTAQLEESEQLMLLLLLSRFSHVRLCATP